MSRRTWTALAAALLILGLLAVVHAQAPGYATSSKCKMCHGAMHKAIVEGWAKTGHSRALLEPADPKALVADFAAGAPIKKEDVKYILASGRHMQAMVGADFKVLPSMWDVKAKKWIATESVDASTQCVGCHVTGYDAAAKKWSENGVTCEACHGAAQEHAGSGDKAKITSIKKLTADKKMAVCARCHARGTDTTKKFAWPTTWKVGEPIDPHFLLAPVVAGAKNQQYNELKTSKHFGAGITCTTCHEPHGANTTAHGQLTKPVNDLCSGCHSNIKDSATHPKVTEGMTCAMCHMPQGVHTFKAPK